MSLLGYLLVAVFLPLFPLSMVFNQLLARLGEPWRRVGLLLLWPQLGVFLLIALGETAPPWILWWAAATAVLYALRALVLRDLKLWIAFMATSSWTLLWPAAAVAAPALDGSALILHALGFSLPLALLSWLASRLEAEFGAAHAGVCGGLGLTMPRLAGLLTLGALAAVAAPLVPGFFTLLLTTLGVLPRMPGVALIILLVWLLWAWGGARMLGGFIPGTGGRVLAADLDAAGSRRLGLGLAALVLAGVSLSGLWL